MKRKQIYLDLKSEKAIKKLAKRTRLSEAEHIRRAVSVYIRSTSAVPTRAKNHPLLELVGICDRSDGPQDAALLHDEYLYGKSR